jgi:predicted transcriptional regulator
VAKLNSVLSNISPEPTYRQRKRNRYEIYHDVLTTLAHEVAEHPRPSLTRVAARVNMPYDRLKDVLRYLTDIGFCERLGAGFKVTGKGAEFLLEYNKFNESLSRMGLEL